VRSIAAAGSIPELDYPRLVTLEGAVKYLEARLTPTG
jgi:hypothetical protein